MLSVTVVLPTYNERENIAPLLRKMYAGLRTRKLEILVVDDNSPDGTGQAVRALFKEIPVLKLIVPEFRAGLAGALRTGYDAARSDIIVSMDADRSFEPDDIERFVRRIEEGVDLVVGSRHAQGGRYEAKTAATKLKRFVSRMGNIVVPWMTGLSVTDCSANFRAMRRGLWAELRCGERGNIILLEMILRAASLGKRVEEIPVAFVERAAGRSKLNLALEIPRYGLRLLRYALLPL